MDKRLILAKNNSRERDVFFVQEDRHYLQKTASEYHPKVQDYISKAKPVDNLIQVLLTALGGWPIWPQNVNGDRFSIPSLEHEGPDYGYQTFVTNANYFVHHINKDPALAKGKVLGAIWNDKAKRVELILGIDPDKDPDAVREIDAGNNLAFSMGCKLPFDQCSNCGNQAKTRAEYCDCLRYMMNQFDPVTGQLVGAWNPFPKFFDISRVLIPADKTAYMWEKLKVGESPITKISSAELAEIPAKKWFDHQYLTKKVAMNTEAYREKTSAKKSASITKEIPVATVKPLFIEKMRRTIPVIRRLLDKSAADLDMENLKGFSLPQIVSTLLALGIVPKSSESNAIFEVFSKDSNLDSNGFGPQSFSPLLARRLSPCIPDRSFARPVLLRRIVLLSAKPAEELKKIADGPDHKGSFNAGLSAGLLAAALAFSGNRTALGNLFAEHPFLMAIFGAAAIRGIKALGPSRPVVTGQYTLAEPGNPLYNNDWQRRFAEAQARPVTVIKTGADNSNLFENTFGSIPFLFALESVTQQPAIKIFETNPSIFTDSLMTKESNDVGQEISHILTSARRFMKSASLEDLNFLGAVPDTSRNSVWDLAILNAADKIVRKLS